MDFNQIRKEVKSLNFEQTRADCENYFEAVLIKKELGKLTNMLESLFGFPAWPSKNKLSSQSQKLISGFGGIMPGQTLYLRSEGKETTFAMLWPWQDGKRVTLKIVQK
ncbi:MAG: hypothetical protein ABSB18_05305 [Candidatus Omnitrophota bacterium]